MSKREDIRITKSKRDLRNALTEMMLTTPFEKITVGEICEKAMVNRMTFYKHYADKYELMNDLLLKIKQSIKTRIEISSPSASIENNTMEFTFALVDAIVEECLDRKQFLMAVHNSELVLTMISTTIEKTVGDLMGEYGKNYRFKYNINLLSSAVTGAASFLIRNWLFHYPEDTKDKFLTNIKEFCESLFDSKILFA